MEEEEQPSFFDDDYHRRCYVPPERFSPSSTPEVALLRPIDFHITQL